MPPIQRHLRFEAAILSRIRSAVTSRSNWAKERSTLSVSRPMLVALLIGMAFNFLATEGRCAAGISFTSRTVLRLGVALLGVRITVSDISALGICFVLAVVGLIALTVATGFAASRFFGRKWRFALLTGGSVAICGASAALALAAVIPPNDKMERNTLFTILAVTTLSTVAMVAYLPLRASARL